MDQKQSAARAATATRYLREQGNIPVQRIVARRVDVTVLVNKGLSQ